VGGRPRRFNAQCRSPQLCGEGAATTTHVNRVGSKVRRAQVLRSPGGKGCPGRQELGSHSRTVNNSKYGRCGESSEARKFSCHCLTEPIKNGCCGYWLELDCFVQTKYMVLIYKTEELQLWIGFEAASVRWTNILKYGCNKDTIWA
jgi:hypothetical protein